MDTMADQIISAKAPEPEPEPVVEQIPQPSEADTLLDQTKKATEELKRVIQENKDTLTKMEKFRAEEIMKGRSEAGLIIPKREETSKEYAARILRGELKR